MGSVLRIVGDMHWLTDVLVGVVAGISIGAGLPLLLLRTTDLGGVAERGSEMVQTARIVYNAGGQTGVTTYPLFYWVRLQTVK